MKNLVVIGAGPAGMVSAIVAAESGVAVTLLEKMPQCGRKMMITGKGRCNLTNSADLSDIISNIPGNGKFLHSSLRAFDNRAVMSFFDSLGVKTKIERGGRVFPVTDKAETAVNALVMKMKTLGVRLINDSPVDKIMVFDGQVEGVIAKNGQKYTAGAVIVATGGASYPATGSSGDGARLAANVGHEIEPLLPSLVPLETAEEWVKDVQGLSLKNVRANLIVDGKKKNSLFGEMMFTHFGVTGPIILSLSRSVAFFLSDGRKVTLQIDLKPALDEARLDIRLKRDFEQYKRKELKNALVDLLPNKLIMPFLQAAQVSAVKKVGQLGKEDLHQLLKTMKALPLTVTKTRPLAEAIVTIGGVSVKEINPKTMESKIVKGLYFAGEVMDIDAYTGGFNLQAAFSTGHAAGTWAARQLINSNASRTN